MGYRQIIIKKSHKIHLKYNSLSIVKEEENPQEVLIPLEDISSILIEDPRTLITSRLLSECSNNGIALYFCDETFLPNTQVLPLNVHYNQLNVYNKQISLTLELKQKIWQIIVKKKIENQLKVLALSTNEDRVLSMLSDFQKNVAINDKTNREGIASKVYFISMYGEDFIRFENSNISNALNYGYTIFHNTISRLLVVYGLNTYLGIWHNSDKNAFNLASDFIEPFRPIVDYFCYWRQLRLENPLSSQNRLELIDLLNKDVRINEKICKVEYAMEVTVKSFLRVLETKNENDLLLPEIIGVNFSDEEFI